MFIIIVAYAFLGCYYFGDINYKNTDILNEHLNFSTFPKSLLSVFIFTTGENWPIAMADCVGRTIRFCVEGKDNCGNLFSPFYFISLQIIINWILLNSFIAIIVDSFVMLLQEHDEIDRMELVKKRFTESWNRYDANRKGFLLFKDFVDMYEEMDIPENFEWSSKKIKFFKTKPPISYLFKNLNVYYNYCTYTDALFCITSFWVNDDLPLNVRNAVWEHNGWNKLIRKKLFIQGEKVTFSSKEGGVPLKEISFGAVYGIYLLQKKYKRIKSCENLFEKKEKAINLNSNSKVNIPEEKCKSIKSAVIDEDEFDGNINNNTDSANKNTNIGNNTITNTNPNANNNDGINTNSNTNIDTDSNLNINSNANINANSNANINTNSNANVNANSNTNININSNANINTNSNANINTNSNADINTNSNSNVNINTNTNTAINNNGNNNAINSNDSINTNNYNHGSADTIESAVYFDASSRTNVNIYSSRNSVNKNNNMNNENNTTNNINSNNISNNQNTNTTNNNDISIDMNNADNI